MQKLMLTAVMGNVALTKVVHTIFVSKSSVKVLIQYQKDGTVILKGCTAVFVNRRYHLESPFESGSDLYEEIWDLIDRHEFEEAQDYYVSVV